jgi:hypothetical protein
MMTPGLATGSDTIKQALKNEMIKTCEARGMSTLTLKLPSKFTVKNYHNLAATQEGVSLTSSTIAKTDRRYASETSLRSCACLMACIAFNQFIETDDDTEVNPNLGEGAQQFMKLLKHVSNVLSFKHIFPKKGTLNDAKDKVCVVRDGKDILLLLEMAQEVHEPVLGGEPSSQPPVLITPEQRPRIERHIFSASSIAASLPIFAVTQDEPTHARPH